MVKQVSSASEFKSELSSAGDKLVVVDFFAEWCGPCKIIAPKLEELSKVHTNVVFLKVDVDALGELAQEYNISAMPTLIFIKSGQVANTIVGANLPQIKSDIEKFSGQPAGATA